MLYIKNNLKFAVKFPVKEEGKLPRYIEFDCLRRYGDTGNIITTGVTPISEEDFELLMKTTKNFPKFMAEGKLEKTKESGATAVANIIDELEKENNILKEQLAKKTEEASMATNDEMKALADENASLKAQLEALGKAKKTAKKAKETF